MYERGTAHWYKDPDGNKVPGVTTAAKMANDGGAFIVTAADSVADWAGDHAAEFVDMTPSAIAKAGKAFFREHRWDAADRGRIIHEHADKLLRGEELEIPDDDVAIVDTFLRMAKEWRLEPSHLESMVISTRWRYCGRLDFLGFANGEHPVLLDWKTGRTGVWPETALQLAAYRHADLIVLSDGSEHPMPPVEMTAAVWLQDDRYQIVPVNTDGSVFRSFLYALETYRFTQRDKSELVLDPLETP
jgi:hypothetical protein